MWFGKENSILGIDIGTSAIKMVQLNQDDSVLQTYGIVDLPKPITGQSSEAEIVAVTDLLRNLVLKARVTTRKCAMSLPNAAVFTSVIDFPIMSDRELDSAIQFEAKKYIPLPVSEVSLSWTLISQDETNNTMKILLIAVPKQVRDVYIRIFEKADLELEVIEIEALALIRTLVTDFTKNDVIIDIGAKATGINFIKQGLLQLTRNLNIGGDTVTEKIAMTLNVHSARAEQFKRDFGLNGTDFLPEAVKPVLSSIKTEIRQLMNLYQSNGVKVDRVVFTGGGSRIPGLLQYFNDMGAAVVYGDTLGRMSYPAEVEPVLQRYSLQLPVAVGLALRKNE